MILINPISTISISIGLAVSVFDAGLILVHELVTSFYTKPLSRLPRRCGEQGRFVTKSVTAILFELSLV